MREYLYRDNKEKLKNLPENICSDGELIKYGRINIAYNNEIRAKMREEAKTRYPNGIPKGVAKHMHPLAECDHCGTAVGVTGLGAHMRSLRCLANRAHLQALLDGYVRGPIQYNSLTSPFSRRYPSKLMVRKGTAGRIGMDLYFEVEWAQLWLKYRYVAGGLFGNQVEPTYTPPDFVKVGGGSKLTRKTMIQLPQEKYIYTFKDIADAKRRGATRKMREAMNQILLAEELTS